MAYPRVQTIENGLRLPRGATLLAQGGVKSLYTINGGAVRVMRITGTVTTAVAATANATKLQIKPTGQTAIDLCAAGDINGLAAGKLVGMTGTVANALLFDWAIPSQSISWTLPPGTIDLNCVGSIAGAIRWVLTWEAVDYGAFVTLA